MKFLRKYADNAIPYSLVNKLRQRRFNKFLEFIQNFEKPVKILDIGGTYNYWKQMGMADSGDLEITLLNIEHQESSNNIKFILQDVSDLSNFKDNEFDVVYSNSLIEHITPFERQKKLASEIIRISKAYYIQTPNYYFPFEPHFLFPFFQFLPIWLKIWLVKHFTLGWFYKAQTKDEALKIISSIRLLNAKDLNKLFPSAKLIKEKFLCITKSLTVIKFM